MRPCRVARRATWRCSSQSAGRAMSSTICSSPPPRASARRRLAPQPRATTTPSEIGAGLIPRSALPLAPARGSSSPTTGLPTRERRAARLRSGVSTASTWARTSSSPSRHPPSTCRLARICAIGQSGPPRAARVPRATQTAPQAASTSSFSAVAFTPRSSTRASSHTTTARARRTCGPTSSGSRASRASSSTTRSSRRPACGRRSAQRPSRLRA
mmetsp:Transcript_49675/g.162415  ORF Transcript_49675/g.162415 Transcript_49675/m.162415 type:complete len:214 (-) Transcript_49675:281-922(-)